MMNVAALIVLAGLGFQDQQTEFHYDFRGGMLDRRLFQMSGADVSKFAKPEADGLRVRIAFDGEDRRVTVATRFRVRGDFEITPTFDVLKVTKPASDTGRSGISLEVATGTPANKTARLHWHVAKNNSYFVAGRAATVDGKRQSRGKRELTKTSLVAVRLVRRGSTLHYFVAEGEGGAFREIGEEEIGTEDLRAVRLVALSRGPKSSLDLRWKDLTIRADALSGLDPILRTVDDERIIARLTALENGTLRLASRPPRSVALEELTRLTFNNPPTLEAHWVGQDNSDFVGAGPNATKNGIQDIHLSLAGLDAAKSIKQLLVVEQENRTTWKLDQNSRLLATFKSDEIAVGEQWQRVSHARVAPVETAMIRVRLLSNRKTGKNNDGYFDALSLSAVGKGQNLLKNPGNEAPLASGKIPNWTNVLGDWTKRSNSPTPREGKAYFFAGVGERGELRQDVDVSAFAKSIATGKQRFVFQGYVRTWPNEPVDTSQIIIEYHQAENSSSSKLGLTRQHGSDGAELYLEPTGDHFGHTFTVAVTYTDGTAALATTKAATHSDSKRKVDENKSKTGPGRRRNLPAITVAMEADDVLRGGLLSLTEEALTLATPWQSELEIPLVQILGLQFGSTGSEEDRGEFQKHLLAPGSTDTVVVRTADGGLTALKGGAQDLFDGKLRFTYEGELRSINQSRLVGLVFAAHPPVRKWTAPYQVFRFFSGDKISGSWSAITGESFQLETAWGSPLTLPARIVSDVSFRNGRLVYLSDREPASVRELSYFGRIMSYRRDKNLLSRPLKLGGKVYAKGLAVHSRCVLSYSLDGRFNRFKTLVGFDDTAEAKGHVLCRVLGDAKVLYEAALSNGAPVPLDLSVAGVEQLTLEIDFGDKEDTGDRVIWANARVLRN